MKKSTKIKSIKYIVLFSRSLEMKIQINET